LPESFQVEVLDVDVGGDSAVGAGSAAAENNSYRFQVCWHFFDIVAFDFCLPLIAKKNRKDRGFK